MPCGREDDHDGSARRDTAIAPPRQICGCSDSISRRDIKEGTRWCFLLTAIIFLQNGLVGRAPFIFLSSRSGSSDINPDCRRMQSLSGPKNLTAPLPARQRNVRLITLIPSRGVPNLGGGRERNGRNRPERGGLICGGEIQFRRLLPSRSLSFSVLGGFFRYK